MEIEKMSHIYHTHKKRKNLIASLNLMYYHVALQTPAKQIYQLMTFLKLFLIFIAPLGGSEVEKELHDIFLLLSLA